MSFYTTALSCGDFLPLFQLMDDYYSDARNPKRLNECSRTKSATVPSQLSFTPKFDVREGDDSYILNGELPGAHQNNIEIQFTDPETMVIKGRVERNYDLTSPEATNDESMSVQIDGDDASSTKSNYHSPTVEDEDETDSNVTPRSVATPSQQHIKPQLAAFKYWTSERLVGNFQRSFTFPTRINQDGVRAIFRNGILSVTVPKEAIKKAKKIRIE